MGFSEQFGLLAQGSGFEDWANILFIVVMVVLWLLAGLVKAIGKKGAQQKQPAQETSAGQQRRPGESWQQRLARRAEELQRRLEKEAGLPTRQTHNEEEPGRRRPPAPVTATRATQAPGGKITVRSGQRGEPVMVYERPELQPSAQREHQVARQREAQKVVPAAGPYTTEPRLEPVRRDAFEPMTESFPPMRAEPPKPLEPGEAHLTAPRESGGSEPAAIIDSTDTDALKKAILHYEILGRPLALRDASERTSAF
jgi:hypothetical protein